MSEAQAHEHLFVAKHRFARITARKARLVAGLVRGQSLNRALDNYTGEKFQTLLLSDTNLDVFKAFRAYDDFEQLPLHGTFIIDGDGRVRWQDIGYEPFMDVNFVLAEAQRLLAQDHAPAAKTEKCEQPAK